MRKPQMFTLMGIEQLFIEDEKGYCKRLIKIP